MELIKGLKLPDAYAERIFNCTRARSNVIDLKQLFPFLDGPMEIATTYSSVKSLSEASVFLEETFTGVESSLRSGKQIEPPLLDYDKSLIFSTNRIPGDDLAIGLDYRADAQHPCVVATNFTGRYPHCEWMVIALNLDEFLNKIGW